MEKIIIIKKRHADSIGLDKIKVENWKLRRTQTGVRKLEECKGGAGEILLNISGHKFRNKQTNKQTINRQHSDRVLALEWSRWIGIIIMDNAVIMDRMTASVTCRVILYHHWGCPATDDTLLIRLIHTNMNRILIYIILQRRRRHCDILITYCDLLYLDVRYT